MGLSPGPKRPGLIEAQSVSSYDYPRQASPGPKRPGLIEASSHYGPLRAPGESPGPKRPGLIEASARRDRFVASSMISRAKAPGPH